MGMLDNWIHEITRPLREIKSKWLGIKNVKDGLVGDISRIKRSVGITDKPPTDPKAPPKP